MNCYYHPHRRAVAQCPDCGKGLCKDCASQYQQPICSECNNKRSREGLKAYITPLIVCLLLFALGYIVGSSFGESPFIMGYIFTCIYGGWSIVGMIFSNIFVSMNIQSIIFYYGLRILLSVIVGVFTTPIHLIYCIYKIIENRTKR